MQATDLYLKLTDPTGKSSPIVTHHRVWDRDLFLASQRQTHEVKAEDGDKRKVQITTQAEYRQYHGYKPEHCK